MCTTTRNAAKKQRRRRVQFLRQIAMLVPSVKLSTVGGRAFPVAGPTIWNSLPDDVISAPSLSTFRQRLKHFCSRPRSLTLPLIPGKLFPTSSGSSSDFITWTTLKRSTDCIIAINTHVCNLQLTLTTLSNIHLKNHIFTVTNIFALQNSTHTHTHLMALCPELPG